MTGSVILRHRHGTGHSGYRSISMDFILIPVISSHHSVSTW